MSSNIFEQATRKALRFATCRGAVTTEDLWQIPLTSKNGFNLDAIARNVNKQLKASEEESFVTTRKNPDRDEDQLRLDILKHVIAVKLAEADARASAEIRKHQRDKLTAILAEKQDEALRDLSPEELQKRLDELSA